MTTYLAYTGNGNLNVLSLPSGPLATLNQPSNHAPAVAFFKGLVYLAWTGTDGRLNVISYDGTNWANQITLGQHSNNGPALIASNNLLSLVWTGTNGNLNLIFSSDGKQWQNQVTLSQTSGVAPASALGAFQDQAIAWIDGNGAPNAVCGMGIAGAAQGVTFSGTSKQGPGLAFYQSLLYIAWTDGTSGKINVSSSADGISGANPVVLNQISTNAPALASSSSGMTLAATGTDNQLSVSTFNGSTWEDPITLKYTSNFAPAIAMTS
ncbi:MAG TPA: hypothetical protein VF435_08440 [Pyrinomonadaceae bacterium]